MVFQRDKGSFSDSFETGLPPAQSGDDVPRWLLILGLVAGLTLLVALLRYALDLLGLVFVIILVGFAIRALSDWLTEGESVSAWAITALSVGLMGTVLVGLWLVNSGDLTSSSLERRLPGPIQRTVDWMEAHGWGQRVLLPGSPASGALAGGSRIAGPGAEPVTGAEASPVVIMRQPPASLPGAGALGAVNRARKAPVSRPTAAEAAAETVPAPAEVPSAAPVEPENAAAPTTVTLTASPSPAIVGRSVRMTAYVRAEGGRTTPSGSVVFSAGDTVLGRAPVRDGTAMLVTLDLDLGEHLLSAIYSGDAAHLPSRSASIAQAVMRK
jgi:hypothetical protein